MRSGMVLNSKYEMDQMVGFGNQGQVWRGRDLETLQDIAIKLFPHTVEKHRYLRELDVLCRLPQHRRVVTYHGHGQVSDHLYLVMEWIEGKSLASVLSVEPQPWHARALVWVKQACEALQYIHRHKVVHRDVKPANLMVTPHDDVILIDFGISRFTNSTLTQGSPMGSAAYLAPERWRGEPGDYRVDLYAIGCIIYEMLIGEPPFGKSGDLRHAHLRRSPTPPGRRVHGVSPKLDELTLQLLAKVPAERPESAGEVAARLSEIVNLGTSTDEITSSNERVRELVVELGPDHPDTLDARLWRAQLIAKGGDIAGAVRECDRIASQYEQLYGPFDPRTLEAREARFRLSNPVQ